MNQFEATSDFGDNPVYAEAEHNLSHLVDNGTLPAQPQLPVRRSTKPRLQPPMRSSPSPVSKLSDQFVRDRARSILQRHPPPQLRQHQHHHQQQHRSQAPSPAMPDDDAVSYDDESVASSSLPALVAPQSGSRRRESAAAVAAAASPPPPPSDVEPTGASIGVGAAAVVLSFLTSRSVIFVVGAVAVGFALYLAYRWIFADKKKNNGSGGGADGDDDDADEQKADDGTMWRNPKTYGGSKADHWNSRGGGNNNNNGNFGRPSLPPLPPPRQQHPQQNPYRMGSPSPPPPPPLSPLPKSGFGSLPPLPSGGGVANGQEYQQGAPSPGDIGDPKNQYNPFFRKPVAVPVTPDTPGPTGDYVGQYHAQQPPAGYYAPPQQPPPTAYYPAPLPPPQQPQVPQPLPPQQPPPSAPAAYYPAPQPQAPQPQQPQQQPSQVPVPDASAQSQQPQAPPTAAQGQAA